MLIFSTQLCELLSSNLLCGSTLPASPLPPLPCVKGQFIQTVCGLEVVGGFESVGDHILQEFNTLNLTDKIARPPQTKT